MVAWYNWTTFDLIGDLAFGEPFGCLQESSYHAWVSMIFESIKVGTWVQTTKRFPALRRLLALFLPKSMMKKREAHRLMTIEKTAKRIERADIDRPDFLSMILKEKGERGMTRPELESNASVLIIAGSETTATLMSGLTYLILRNRRVFEKLATEIRSTFAREEDINLNSVNSLKYLHAVINETLRVYPPVPTNLPRIVSAEGDNIGDQWVPPGVSDQ
jgi:cytochrome P450